MPDMPDAPGILKQGDSKTIHSGYIFTVLNIYSIYSDIPIIRCRVSILST